MKHCKLFLEFVNTTQEGREMYKKYIQILNEKAQEIELYTESMGKVKKTSHKPTINLIGNDTDLNRKPTYLTIKIDYSREKTFHIDLYIEEDKIYINIHKPFNIMIDKNNISKVVENIKNASDYMGGISNEEIDKIERLLCKKLLTQNGSVSEYVNDRSISI